MIEIMVDIIDRIVIIKIDSLIETIDNHIEIIDSHIEIIGNIITEIILNIEIELDKKDMIILIMTIKNEEIMTIIKTKIIKIFNID